MDYIVVGSDGKDYGPYELDKLKAWVQEGKLTPQTRIKTFSGGQEMPASSVAGLFSADQPIAPPQFAQASQPVRVWDDGKGEFWRSVIYSALAVVLFFALHGLGLILAGYAVYYSIQSNTKGNRMGMAAIAISVLALAAVCIGWYLRISGNAMV